MKPQPRRTGRPPIDRPTDKDCAVMIFHGLGWSRARIARHTGLCSKSVRQSLERGARLTGRQELLARPAGRN